MDRATGLVVERGTYDGVSGGTWNVADTVVLPTCPRKRLQALEQLVVTMQSGGLQAKTAAAQAEQRVTDAEARALCARNEGVVDTRWLGKPKSFDGAMDNWRSCLANVGFDRCFE